MQYSLNGKKLTLQELVDQVSAYGDGLPEKLRELRRRVALEMAELADDGFGGAWYDDVIGSGMKLPRVEVYIMEKGDAYLVIAEGDSVIWQEFGAGVYYNGPAGSSPHPWGAENAFLIGKYGKGNGARKVWGYFDPPYARDEEHLKLTHGTPASKPLYNAYEDVKHMVKDIAREVFGNG